RLIALLRAHDRRKDALLRQALQGEYVAKRVMLHDFQYRVGDFQILLPNVVDQEERASRRMTPGEVIARILRQRRQLGRSFTGGPDAIDYVRMAAKIDDMTDADYEREAAIANAGFRSLLETCDRPVWERRRLASRIHDQFARNQSSRIVRYAGLPEV